MQSTKAWFFIILQFLVPKLLITNIVYYITRIKNTVFKNYLIQNFIKIYNVNTDEIKIKNLDEYSSFNAFLLIPHLKVHAPDDNYTALSIL